MDKIKNFISVGDLLLDIYYEGDQLLGYCSGGSISNDLCNLKQLNYSNNCICFGNCGNDWGKEVICKSLHDFSVSTDYINYIDKPTNKFHILISNNSSSSQVACPNCKNISWYSNSRIGKEHLDNLLKLDCGIIIVDTLKNSILDITKVFRDNSWIIALDMGYINHLRFMTKEKIINLLTNIADIVQINYRVYRFLQNKLQSSEDELFNFLGCKLLIITNGEYDANIKYLYNERIKNTYIKPVRVNAKDTTGAGDAFFSFFLNSYDEIINANFSTEIIEKVGNGASTYASKRVCELGALGKIYDYNLFNNNCNYCGYNEQIKIKSKNSTQKVATNVNFLLDRITRALESDAVNKLSNILYHEKGNVFIIGTGGSYPAACYACSIINANLKSLNAFVYKPRDILIHGVDKADLLILFSYSGKTPDILNIYKYCKKEKKKVFIITKLDPELENTDCNSEDIISYNSAKSVNTRERGFISIAGTLIPMCIFAKLFYDEKQNSFYDFINNCFNERSKELIEISLSSILSNRKLNIDVFMSYDSMTPALDLESKFVESGLGRITMHEIKDFSHGRFNIIEKFPPDLIIYIKNSTGDYSNKLIEYLKKREFVIHIIQTKYKNHLGELDLVIGVQYLIKYISDIFNYDMAKPKYPQDAMLLYKYKGKSLL